jgi:hypothetical protein
MIENDGPPTTLTDRVDDELAAVGNPYGFCGQPHAIINQEEYQKHQS